MATPPPAACMRSSRRARRARKGGEATEGRLGALMGRIMSRGGRGGRVAASMRWVGLLTTHRVIWIAFVVGSAVYGRWGLSGAGGVARGARWLAAGDG